MALDAHAWALADVAWDEHQVRAAACAGGATAALTGTA
jgi:hypothetical protein